MMDNDTESGLGLGLNALFDENENNAIIEEKIQDIPDISPDNALDSGKKRLNVGIEQLYPSRFQPRRLFDENSIDELAESIKQYGVLQPLLVREDPESIGNYEIIAGERRWRASQKARLHNLPVVVLEINELEAFKIALIENLQREDLDPIDEALGYRKLLEDYDQTQESLAKAVGKSRSHITNMVRLLTLPDMVQSYLSTGELSMGHVRALITAEDPQNLADQVISKGLSVRQTEKFAADKKGVEQQKRPRAKRDDLAIMSKTFKDADTLALEKDISNALGMNVSIDSADGHSGKLSVEFKSLDQLDEILHRLAHFPNNKLDG